MMMSPDYVMTLFTDPRGQMMLGGRPRQHRHRRLRHVADDPVRDLRSTPMASSPLAVLGLSAALAARCCSAARATGSTRSARGCSGCAPRPASAPAGSSPRRRSSRPKNSQLQQGALAFMTRLDQGRCRSSRARQLSETRKLLVSAGFRSPRRDRRLHLLQAGVAAGLPRAAPRSTSTAPTRSARGRWSTRRR